MPIMIMSRVRATLCVVLVQAAAARGNDVDADWLVAASAEPSSVNDATANRVTISNGLVTR